MPFPKIEHCLVCEDIIPQPSNLSSLLGFYGVAPRVKISVFDFSKPIPRLTLLFLTEEVRTGGDYQLSLRLLDPSQDLALSPTLTAKVSLKPDPRKRVQLAINFFGTKFSGPGTCKVSVSIDGSPFYETEFQLIQGTRGVVGDSSSGILELGQAEGESSSSAGEE